MRSWSMVISCLSNMVRVFTSSSLPHVKTVVGSADAGSTPSSNSAKVDIKNRIISPADLSFHSVKTLERVRFDALADCHGGGYSSVEMSAAVPCLANQAKMAFTFAINWLGRASIWWLAPGTLTSAVSTPSICNAL